jgi:hypothetical protein
MLRRTRVLVLGATLAAMNLAGLTAVAHAQANDDPDGKNARRLATERQAGETWRKHPPVTSQPTTMDAAVRQLLRERSSIPARHPPRRPPQRLPNPADTPAGSSLPSVGWLRYWRSSLGWPCWPPGGRAAELEWGTQPDHTVRWGCRAHPAAPSAFPSTITC